MFSDTGVREEEAVLLGEEVPVMEEPPVDILRSYHHHTDACAIADISQLQSDMFGIATFAEGAVAPDSAPITAGSHAQPRTDARRLANITQLRFDMLGIAAFAEGAVADYVTCLRVAVG
jgi:hypothetical protein